MSIEREYNEFNLICDSCLCSITFSHWFDALEHAKSKGWNVKKEDNDWIHICVECQ